MLLATEYIGSVGRGITHPELTKADDDLVYVVKLQNNRMGRQVLVNEYIAQEIGHLMNLCFPHSELIYLSQDVKTALERKLNKKINRGPHFASRFLSHSHFLTGRNLAKAVNRFEMAGIMFFDHLFHNFDRTHNRRNLLIRREEGGAKIYAIDHSHLFYRGRWELATLRRQEDIIKVNSSRIYGLLLSRYLESKDFEPYVTSFREITDEQLVQIMANIPEEWQVNGEQQAALVQYIIHRRQLAEDICAAICRLIPNKNRRTELREGK